MAADGVSWFGLYPPVLLWKMAFFFIMDKSFDFTVGQIAHYLFWVLFASVYEDLNNVQLVQVIFHKSSNCSLKVNCIE